MGNIQKYQDHIHRALCLISQYPYVFFTYGALGYQQFPSWHIFGHKETGNPRREFAHLSSRLSLTEACETCRI